MESQATRTPKAGQHGKNLFFIRAATTHVLIERITGGAANDRCDHAGVSGAISPPARLLGPPSLVRRSVASTRIPRVWRQTRSIEQAFALLLRNLL